MRVFRGDRGLLNKPKRLPNGFLQADAFFTRVGVFPYQNKDGTIRRELRLVEEVFKPDSMKTFEMSTVTMGHPREPVTSKNARQLGIGTTGQDVRRDSNKMRGTILVSDSDAIRAMDAGRREISNGYFCDLEKTSGVTKNLDGIEDGLAFDCIQRNIVGNHVAIVERGRAGPEVSVRIDEMRCDGVDDYAWSELHFDDGDLFSSVGDDEDVDPRDVSTTSIQRLAKHASKADEMLHVVGFVAWPIIWERGLTVTEVAQALGVQENGVEPLLAGEVMPTGLQLEGLAELIDVPVETLKDLLPERQRELTDREDVTMEEFKIVINDVTFTLKGDTAAQQAVTKALADGDAKTAELTSKIALDAAEADKAFQTEKARADAADEAKVKAEAARDAAIDPTAIRKRIDERVSLERTASEVLGENFDAAKSDDEIRSAVILSVQPEAKLDGQPEAYVAARFDSAVEIFEKNKTDTDDVGSGQARVRVAARDAGGLTADERMKKARDDADEKRRNAWRQPLAATKDAAPESVRIKH